MTHTLRLTQIWFTWYLDKTLDLDFKVDSEKVKTFGGYWDGMMYFVCEKNMNFEDPRVECYGLNQMSSPKLMLWLNAQCNSIKKYDLWKVIRPVDSALMNGTVAAFLLP